jgi:hypothetical protein
MAEIRNAYKILVRKPEVKRSLGIPRRRWDINVEIDLKGQGRRMLIGSMWLKIGTSCGLS